LAAAGSVVSSSLQLKAPGVLNTSMRCSFLGSADREAIVYTLARKIHPPRDEVTPRRYQLARQRRERP
jgi:hypothetical protein